MRERRSLDRPLLCGVLVAIFLSTCSTTLSLGGAPQPPTGTLRWRNGDTLSGQLIGVDKSRLRWRSPCFTTAFSLDIQQLASIQFPQGDRIETNEEPFRLVSQRGDVLYGRLGKLDQGRVVLTSGRWGRLELNRSAVRGLYQMQNSGAFYSGPSGLTGWRTLRRNRRISDWQADAQGRLSTEVVGAELFRDLKLPAAAEIDIVLLSRRRLGFTLAFAPPNATRLRPNTIKLETAGDVLMLQNLGRHGRFQTVQTLSPKTRSMRLRLLWLQATGEFAVYAASGKRLGTLKTTGEERLGHTGLYICNKGADLTVAAIRVRSWGEAGLGKTRQGESLVRLTDNRVLRASVQSYDPSAEKLTIVDASGRRSIPLSQIDSVDFGTSRAQPAEPSEVWIRYADGGQIRGRLRSVREDSFDLATPLLQQLMTCPLEGVRGLFWSSQDAPSPPESPYVLEYRNTRLHGQLFPAGPQAKLGWQPEGSDNASPLSPEHPARIVRSTNSQNEFPAQQDTDIVYLRNGDVLPCRVTGIDETDVSLQAVYTRPASLPRQAVKAVDFGTTLDLPLDCFDDLWIVPDEHLKNTERTREAISFHGTATLSHPRLLRFDQIEFTVRWSPLAQLVMYISLYAKPDQPVPRDLMVYFMNGQVFANVQQGQQRAMQAIQLRPKTKERESRIRIVQQGRQCLVFFNKQQVQALDLPLAGDSGSGISIYVRQEQHRRGAKPPEPADDPLLTLSDLQATCSGKSVTRWLLDDTRKQYLLTVPRNREKNPPTHVMLARNGDVVRGRLIGLTGDQLLFHSRLNRVTVPRERLESIVWLEEIDSSEAPSADSGQRPLQAVFDNGIHFSFTADRLVDNHILGRHPWLGDCRLPVDAVKEIRLGGFSASEPARAYADWQLVAAAQPRFDPAAGQSMSGAENNIFASTSPLVGTQQDFTAALLSGGSFRLSKHPDKIVILEFWATWCGPCVHAMPDLLQAVESLPANRVTLLGINHHESPRVIQEFLAGRGWDLTVALDPDGQLAQQFQVDSLPQTVIIGPGGRVECLHLGAIENPREALEKAVSPLLRGAD